MRARLLTVPVAVSKPRLTLTKATRGKKISVRVTVSGSGLPSSTVTVKVKGVVR